MRKFTTIGFLTFLRNSAVSAFFFEKNKNALPCAVFFPQGITGRVIYQFVGLFITVLMVLEKRLTPLNALSKIANKVFANFKVCLIQDGDISEQPNLCTFVNGLVLLCCEWFYCLYC